MRFSFGANLADWVFTVNSDLVSFASSATVTFWDSQTGGTQYTDLAGAADGSSPMSSVTTGDGSSVPTGNIPRFYGPDGISTMWAASGGNPRQLIKTNEPWRVLGHKYEFTVAGNLTVATGKVRLYNDTGQTLTIRSVRATVNTAPTGAAIRVDVNKNGTTIFTTQASRPSIAISGNTSKVTNMDVTTLADGDYLTADVDVIGSTIAGADLAVLVLAA